MAMTYDESAQLMTDLSFKGRVKVACLKYADTCFNEAPSVEAHNVHMKWAANCFQNPDMTAQQVQPPTVMDANVQAAGPAVDDATLQSAVEATIKKMM